MFEYIFLPTDTPVIIPPEMTQFKCLILIERDVSEDYRHEVSKTLVEASCLYTLAWGRNCTLWDDSVDWAFLEHYNHKNVPEEKFVTTTFHPNETLEEVIEFAKDCTEYSLVRLEDTLVLDFTQNERGDFIRELFLRDIATTS